MRRLSVHAAALLGALVCPLALLLLVEIRPPLPALPHSLAAVITLEFVRSVLELLAWGAATALAGVLLLHSLHALFAFVAAACTGPGADA